MCCRYHIEQESITHFIFELLLNIVPPHNSSQADLTLKISLAKTGEIFPTDLAPTLSLDQNNQIDLMILKWGFPTFKEKGLVINGREETIHEKPLFKNSKIGIVPANGFFEWKKSPQSSNKEKHFITNHRGNFYMAGLCQNNNFLILTTNSNQYMKPIHDRMPVILDLEIALNWLMDKNFSNLMPYKENLYIKKINPPPDPIQKLSFF
jgi:putative SOS response-associated peptidase YedK